MSRGGEPAGELQALLDAGLEARLYTGAAAGLWTPAGRVLAYSGSHAGDDPTPAGPSSVFDLASVTKTFTAAAAVRLIESGRLDPDRPGGDVLDLLPDDRATGITARQLLTHTSGLPAESFVWRDATIDPGERLARVLRTPLESSPDLVYRYSCVGYVAAGELVARVAGMPLGEALDDLVLRPLGLASITYGPVDRDVAVATEDQPWVGRGLVRGEVHDELSWFLGGQSGNAGLFGTLEDVLAFAASFLGGPLWSPEGLRLMTTDALEPRHGASFGQAVGPRLNDPETLGSVEGLGHAGFTGTMWIALPSLGVAAALLTNRVYPSRTLVDIRPFRRRFSAWAAATGAVAPGRC